MASLRKGLGGRRRGHLEGHTHPVPHRRFVSVYHVPITVAGNTEVPSQTIRPAITPPVVLTLWKSTHGKKGNLTS